MFPDPAQASPEGLLAIGGDLTVSTLLAAYRQGIFPWYGPEQPILWWTPDPRCVLFPEHFHISRSLGKRLRSARFQVSADRAFTEVISACARTRLDAGESTWISAEMHAAYVQLHELGYAHSIETWQDERLVGGLYGVSLGSVFFGESMFSLEPDASKVAMAHLVTKLRAQHVRLIDCQVYSPHLASLGAEEIPRTQFQQLLAAAVSDPDHLDRWNL